MLKRFGQQLIINMIDIVSKNNLKLDKQHATSSNSLKSDDILNDLDYICCSSELITDSLGKGFDVAQLPNGDISVSEIQTINVYYSWDHKKHRMVKIGQKSSSSNWISNIQNFIPGDDIKDDFETLNESKLVNEQDILIVNDPEYISGSSNLITQALKSGFDIAQMPNGDIRVYETRIVNVYYTWDKKKLKMVKKSRSDIEDHSSY